MKIKPITHLLTRTAAFAAWLLTFALCLTAFAQGTAFTYQGRLDVGASPANGSYDFMGKLYDVLSNQVSITITNTSVLVSNGLFTTTLDFGSAFAGDPRWLNLWVRSNGGGAFTALTPGQKITAAPYAITAEKVTGLIPDSQITGPILRTTFNGAYTGQLIFTPLGVPPFAVGNALKVTDLNADLLDGLDSMDFWKLSGNAGTTPGTHFLGTTDNKSLTMKVNNTAALQFTPGVTLPNIVGGLAGFRPSVIASGVSGAVIAGGNAPSGGVDGFGAGDFQAVYDDDGTIGGGFGNKVGSANADVTDAAFATVAGGVFNNATAYAATVGGGDGNLSGGSRSFVGGGYGNTAGAVNAVIAGGANNRAVGLLNFLGGLQPADGSCIGGGEYNSISPREEPSPPPFPFPFYFNALDSVIGGGLSNTISGGSYASIPGGLDNTVKGDFGLAAGHRAKANHAGAFVWGDSTDADFASTAANQFAIRASGGVVLSDSTPSISFGSTTRQMLNLWGTAYGIGIQSSTLYSRCDAGGGATAGFIWYKGGVHNDAYANAGGGTEMMHLVSAGLYVNGAIVLTSDRNAKENFAPVSPREVLDKVAALPISRWNYKEDKASEHLGPMAQDFYAAFGVGPDDKHITTVDADGVALSAIQGLNQKLEQKETEIAALKQRVDKLERLMNQINGGAK